MNAMTDRWTVFGCDQGQAVEVAYRYDDATDSILRRTTDRSDGRVDYDSAPCPDDMEWNGSEGVAPWGQLAWQNAGSYVGDE